MIDDATLLRRYATERSEAAFAEFVQRHLPRVNSAAFRRLRGDVHGAQDVAQSAFCAAAREVDRLAQHPVLTGWLQTALRDTRRTVAVHGLVGEPAAAILTAVASAALLAGPSKLVPERAVARLICSDMEIDGFMAHDRSTVVLEGADDLFGAPILWSPTIQTQLTMTGILKPVFLSDWLAPLNPVTGEMYVIIRTSGDRRITKAGVPKGDRGRQLTGTLLDPI